MSSNNPLSRGYAAIVDALESWAPLMSIVRLGNVQTLQSPGFKPRTNVGAGDRVELLLLERRIRATPFLDSTTMTFECMYPLQCATGQLGIDTANLLAILVMQSLVSKGPQLNIPDIVTKWTWADAALVRRDDTADRPDWTVVGGVVVTFGFRRREFLMAAFT